MCCFHRCELLYCIIFIQDAQEQPAAVIEGAAQEQPAAEFEVSAKEQPAEEMEIVAPDIAAQDKYAPDEVT